MKRRAQTAIPRQRQIQLAFQHPVDQLGIARDARLDPHLWIGAREAAQHLRQKRLAEILLQPQPHRALQIQPAHRGGGFVIELQQAARVTEQGLPRLGHHHAASGLAQDRRADLLLQLFQVGADRRRRTPQPFSRLREAAQLDAGDEAA